MDKLEYLITHYNEGVYIVEEGESLTEISNKFSTTEILIISDNCLKCQPLEGEALYIKSYALTYMVKPADTLDSVSQKFNVSKEELLRINRVNYIYPTQKIVIY